MEIINCIVCYANEEEIITYANELAEQDDSNSIRLVVTVNRKKWSKDEFQKALNNVAITSYIYESDTNLGYLNGLVYGYTKYIQSGKSCGRWVIFGNTDIHFTQTNFISYLIKHEYSKDIWLIGPSVIDSMGKYSNPMRTKRYTKFDLVLRKKCYTSKAMNSILNAIHYIHKSNDTEKKQSDFCYMVHGCFMILDRDLVELVAVSEKWELMYAEEIFLAENVIINKKRTYYDCNIEVVHDCGAVTNNIDSADKRRMNVDSINRILRDYYN